MNSIQVGVRPIVVVVGNGVTVLNKGGAGVVLLLTTPGHESVPFSVT